MAEMAAMVSIMVMAAMAAMVERGLLFQCLVLLGLYTLKPARAAAGAWVRLMA